MKTLLITFAYCLVVMHSYGQIYTGPIAKPSTGYGSDGNHTVGVESFPNPYYPTEDIKIYHPSDITTPVPTLFYSHGFGGYIPAHIIGLLNFIAKKGYAIVFVPYQTNGVSVSERYENLLEGFRKAAQDYPGIIDTTKVGFLGHSFGGGASIATAYKCFTENNWGQNGRFIHPSAPWYSFNITQTELQSFPSDTKLVMEVYNDDVVNDHRMAIDIFTTINISNTEKDFITVKADTVGDYIYSAGHDMPTSYAAFDALDYYAYYRLIDALCDYTFNGSLAGKEVALGNGIGAQITMPTGLQSLVQTDTPTALYPETIYGFPCSSVGNPRNMYCDSTMGTNDNSLNENAVIVYPNPTSGIVHINAKNQNIKNIKLFNLQGQFIQEYSADNFSVTNLSEGVYTIKVETDKAILVKKLIKQ